MAQYSEANAKTQAAAIATALTLIWGDTVDTRVNLKLTDPTHPMRRLEKLLNFNPATGVVTSDDVYITGAYDGKHINKGSKLDVLARATCTLTTITIEDADKSKIIATYSMQLDTVRQPAVADFSFTHDGTPVSISTVVVTGATLLIDLNADTANGDAITVTYNPALSSIKNPVKPPMGNPIPAMAAEVVTNNVT